MITVKQADILLQSIEIDWGVCSIDINDSEGEVLRETIISDRDFPPFDRVAMDGYALSFTAWEEGGRTFTIQEEQKAGDPQITLKNKLYCIGVSTGGILPEGCDCVIKKEDILRQPQLIEIPKSISLKLNQNIHHQGSDYPKKTILLRSGVVISPTEIGILASVGKHTVHVSKKPKIAVIATGNELVPIEDTPKNYQIRLSNSYVIQSALKLNKFNDVDCFQLKDDYGLIEKSLETYLSKYDVLVFSGGVSAGNFDFIPKALTEAGVKEIFHKIKQRPGKPLWVGKKEHRLIFGLPGNPVSAITCLYRYILPNLNRLSRKTLGEQETIKLAAPIEFKKSLTLLNPVKITNIDGTCWGTPIATNGSGDLVSLTKSDGFIECEAERDSFPKGALMRVYKWRN